MARYTPEFLAALRHRYEKTDQPMRSLAAEAGIGISTLQALVTKEGWAKRSQRTVVGPGPMRLLEEARALAASPPPERGRASPGLDPATDGSGGFRQTETPSATLPLSGGGSAHARVDGAMIADGHEPPTVAPLSAIERIEALVTKEIEAEEIAREELRMQPRARGDAERCARTLATLTQTLQTVQRMRSGQGPGTRVCDCDDMPEDMDAFRIALAHRIQAFIASREAQNEVEAPEGGSQ